MKIWGWFTLYWVRLCWAALGLVIGVAIGQQGWSAQLILPIAVSVGLMCFLTIPSDCKYRRINE